MKKISALVLALVLALCAVSSLAEGVSFTCKYFTLTLPDSWVIDTDFSGADSDETTEPLGWFYDGSKPVSLWDGDSSLLRDYEDMLLDELKEDQAVSLGVVTAGKIPFVVIRAADKSIGEYIYAETVTNGYAIEFTGYMADEEGKENYPLTDEAVEQFKNILLTFVPVT